MPTYFYDDNDIQYRPLLFLLCTFLRISYYVTKSCWVSNVSEVKSLPEQSLGMCWTDSGWTNRTISKASSLEFKPNKTYLMLWKQILYSIELPKYTYSTVWKINPKHKEKIWKMYKNWSIFWMNPFQNTLHFLGL